MRKKVLLQEFKKLEEKAKELRRKVLILTYERKEGHLGGGFSAIEILIWLYFKQLKKEDKFILSKGHAYYPLYFILKEKGYHPQLLSHPELDEKNGVYATTGSLGHGLPMAVGMALARKIQKKKGRIYVLVGDGELEEGTTWEASIIASRYHLNNLVVIVDYNGLQALDKIEKIAPSFKNLKKIFENIGYQVKEADGHSFYSLKKAFEKLDNSQPKMIIAYTVKGKGVSFMENNYIWQTRAPSDEEFQRALEELK